MTPRAPQDVARQVAAAVAGYGLAGSMGNWPAEPLDAETWQEFCAIVREQRVTGLLVDAIASGTLAVTDEQADEASEAHFTAVCGVLMLEAGLLRAIEVLEAAGVEARVLKGSAFAHLDYPDPAQRVFGDVDLIVRGEQFDDAVAALTADGCWRRFPQPRPGFDRRFSKGTSFFTPDGLALDLHRTFVMGPFGLRVQLDDVWEGEERFRLGGRDVGALDAEVRFLHACYHAALGDVEPRLVPQRDVAQMLLSDRLDLDRVRTLMHRWSGEPVVARAVCLSWETLQIADITALSAWAQHYAPSARARRDLAVYSDPGGSYAAKSLAAIAALPSVRDKLSFATALAFPERTYVEGRHEGVRSRWRTGISAVRGHRTTR